jgi:ketosteroid isomerase-like protein
VSAQLERNKQVIVDYFREQEAAGLGRALRYLADDATWWVPGQWELSGTYTKRELAAAIDQLPYDGYLTFGIGAMTAESDRVAAEIRVQGKLKDGRHFDFWIHFLFTVESGLITSVKEYVDSQYTRQLFFGGGGSPGLAAAKIAP